MNEVAEIVFQDFSPETTNVLEEVMRGLSLRQKALPPKLLYDKKGSEIFEQICDVPEYYPTRAEKEILSVYAKEMADMLGEGALVIEPGSGAGEKVRYLLKELKNPAGYVPIEISREILLRMTDEFTDEFPNLVVSPICADFTKSMDFPLSIEARAGKKVIFFPGSTIGNLSQDEAIHFLKNCSQILPSGGGFLIGVDRKKDKSILELAYDDPQGVTAAFNLNLLERLNRELDGTFDMTKFTHKSFYNQELGRVEMHLESLMDQLVRIDGTTIHFREGETIHTENSYKYTCSEFSELCAKAGLELKKTWHDSRGLFCVYYFEKE